MEQMGLLYDPNKIIGLPKPYKGLGLPDPQEMEEVAVNDMDGILQLGKQKKEVKTKTKKHVVEQLEAEASIQPPKLFKFGPEISKFIVKMIGKHGADLQAMQRDSANRYQYSAGQIRSLIKKFINIPTNRRAYQRVVQSAAQEGMSTQ
jgi:Ribosome biogenesis protein Nop16